ncbi:hypothetical protein [Pseudochryseolinea flava]|uniref:DUF4412 domain-containing protein n=1 Tax=Pseudochryseolinea flava TaxID=2059302 RepID=A0A364XU95_9BACT|nr:hypothetical protein [Pseudochryseolinea flava]RAV97710.1 hypothetical protein DQQ10_27105 [Pseudochryseolinea flava]
MKLTVIVALAMLPHIMMGQVFFEGKILYTFEVKSKSLDVDVNDLQTTVGNGSTLYFKDGNLRRDYDGSSTEFEMYRSKENRLYVKKRTNDTIFWYDCSLEGIESIKDLQISKQKEKVLGVSCHKLKIRYTDYYTTEYYNSDSIVIDPLWFANFKRDDHYKIAAIEKSLFLRSDTEFPMFTVVIRATRVDHVTLSDDVFKIPSNAIVSPR